MNRTIKCFKNYKPQPRILIFVCYLNTIVFVYCVINIRKYFKLKLLRPKSGIKYSVIGKLKTIKILHYKCLCYLFVSIPFDKYHLICFSPVIFNFSLKKK